MVVGLILPFTCVDVCEPTQTGIFFIVTVSFLRSQGLLFGLFRMLSNY